MFLHEQKHHPQAYPEAGDSFEEKHAGMHDQWWVERLAENRAGGSDQDTDVTDTVEGLVQGVEQAKDSGERRWCRRTFPPPSLKKGKRVKQRGGSKSQCVRHGA